MSGRLEDITASKRARSEFGKRGLDVGQCDVRVHHGRCMVRGVIRLIPGHAEKDVDAAVDKVILLLRQRPDIKEVVFDAEIKGSGRGRNWQQKDGD